LSLIQRLNDRLLPGLIQRADLEPLEGTLMSLGNSAIPNFWAENGLSVGAWFPGDDTLARRVWVSNRCIQLNAQQLSSMPIKFNGGTDEPMWVSNPDPHWYPNGVGDAIFAIVAQLYGWGFSCQYVTDYYATGFPRTWTVLDSSRLQIRVSDDGSREYRVGGRDDPLDARRIIQIDRNPGAAVQGTSAMRAYAQVAWGLLAAGNQSTSVNTGGVPSSVLKSTRKLTKEQAEAIQTQWAAATSRRSGLPPVLPPELDFHVLSFNPSDLALLDTQEFNARALATAFGVPSVLLNMALQGGLTYQNPLALMQMWWLTELRTTAKRIGDAFTAQALPRGQWISFDASDITTVEITPADDEQLSQVAPASPTQQTPRLSAIGGGP
jgi:HK97 family phage portal protein